MGELDFRSSYGSLVKNCFNDLKVLLQLTIDKELQNVLDISQLLVDIFESGNKVLIFGNGGSAADAQHLAAEFINRFLINRSPLPAIALHTDTSVITSISNDFSFDDVFTKQVQALGKKGDVAWGISTSGNSTNVVQALMTAKEKGLVTVGFSGAGGGEMADCCDYLVAVESAQTPRIQELHILLGHIICQIVEDYLFGAQIQPGNREN